MPKSLNIHFTDIIFLDNSAVKEILPLGRRNAATKLGTIERETFASVMVLYVSINQWMQFGAGMGSNGPIHDDKGR